MLYNVPMEVLLAPQPKVGEETLGRRIAASRKKPKIFCIYIPGQRLYSTGIPYQVSGTPYKNTIIAVPISIPITIHLREGDRSAVQGPPKPSVSIHLLLSNKVRQAVGHAFTAATERQLDGGRQQHSCRRRRSRRRRERGRVPLYTRCYWRCGRSGGGSGEDITPTVGVRRRLNCRVRKKNRRRKRSARCPGKQVPRVEIVPNGLGGGVNIMKKAEICTRVQFHSR